MKTKYYIRNNFYLSPKYYGQNLIIRVENQGFYYDHDEIVKAQKEIFSIGGSAYRSWSNYGYYSKTNGFPDWANDYIKKIKL